MKMKRAVLAPTVVAVIALATGGWFLQRGVSQEGNVYFQARLFEEVLHHISDRYVDAKEPSTLYRMAIDGLLHELGDPHTAFMTPEDYNQLKVQTQGEYGGIGAEIDVRDGWVTVVAPLPNSPAERAGLQAGDRIMEVDGESTRGWTTDEAVSRLRGPKGRPVELRIGRLGLTEPIPFRLVRDEIHIESVRTKYMMDGGIGYVDVRVFSESTTSELQAAIDDLRAQGMRGLVIDLRNNPGGLLDQAISASDLFLDRGKPVSELRGRASNMNQRFRTSTPDQYPGLPIVVLVGPSTASAAEILAGALQDHDRALVVGRPSYGKGSVQTLFPLPAGHYLKMTTARWYTPLGRSIHRPEEDDSTMYAAVGEVEVESRPTYETPGGRTVYGGGGITPDLVVQPDLLTDEEVEFRSEVLRYGSKYYDLLYGFAIQYTHEHPNLEPDFPITDRCSTPSTPSCGRTGSRWTVASTMRRAAGSGRTWPPRSSSRSGTGAWRNSVGTRRMPRSRRRSSFCARRRTRSRSSPWRRGMPRRPVSRRGARRAPQRSGARSRRRPAPRSDAR